MSALTERHETRTCVQSIAAEALPEARGLVQIIEELRNMRPPPEQLRDWVRQVVDSIGVLQQHANALANAASN